MARTAGEKSPGGGSTGPGREDGGWPVGVAGDEVEPNRTLGAGALDADSGDGERTATLGRGPPSGGEESAKGGGHLPVFGQSALRWSVPSQIWQQWTIVHGLFLHG